ncbi:MAG: tRNA (adenosine(37)-N6)-dimethylallyltransferase MiaA [Trinickia sp.]|uniref:tRNA (adenosine(37)-N6)-dimethylallyltransferase MiaA n=1 Tax=Trinickia sp. TaxID=2571163 RepID=UPI003F7FF618
MNRPAIACLLGPTASGKTAAALACAERLPIEIVSVDSALVYRTLDIGTAKPTPAERAAVPHHLIDIVEPTASYSAAEFRADALRLIDEIRSRGHIPLFVGGTMLYYRALAHGLDDLPAADADIRAELEAQAARAGWPALHARLAAVDPVTAARLAPNDAQRIQRALEIYLVAGQPMSTLLASAAGNREASPYRFVPIALEPSDRGALHARIARRFDAMLAAGFIDEVAALRARGDLDPSMPSMRCVGYRQAWEYLDGTIDSATMRDKAIFATRQLCKRQLTWLRAMTERVVIDCCADSATHDAVEAIERALDTR